MIGPVWPVGAGCYSQAALPMHSRNRCTLVYTTRCYEGSFSLAPPLWPLIRGSGLPYEVLTGGLAAREMLSIDFGEMYDRG